MSHDQLTNQKNRTDPLWRVPAVFCVTLLVSFTHSVSAQVASPGTLDPSFGSAGARVVAQSSISAGGEFRAIKRQPDGKIVAAGLAANSSGSSVFGMIARFTPTGALDTDFGTGGIVNLPPPGAATQATVNDIAITPDGKIVFTGEALVPAGYSVFLVGRLLANGALDTDFASTGQTLRNLFSQNQGGVAVGVQSDGKIPVTGYYTTAGGVRGVSRYRYNVDGSVDSTFQSSNNTYSGGYITPSALLIRSDDQLVIAAEYLSPASSNAYQNVIYNYSPNGVPESPPGYAFPTTPTDNEQVQAIGVTAAGQILSTGTANVGGEAVAIARRHLVNGQLTNSFSNGAYTGPDGGTIGVALPGGTTAGAAGRGIHEFANGDLVMTGFVRFGTASESWFTSRISATGTVPTGGYTAKVMEIKPNNQNGLALASTLAHDGNVVLAGYLTDAGSGRGYPAIAKVAVNAVTANDSEVVEYFSPSLVKYFMSARLNEKQLLDQPNAAGLARTGVTFKAYTPAANTGKAVCRFFASLAGQFSTHFYLTETADITAVSAQPWATNESIDMYFTAPVIIGTTRTCPAGTHNIWRVFKQKANPAATGTDPNHRYVRTAAELATMASNGYTDEGIVFCGRL